MWTKKICEVESPYIPLQYTRNQTKYPKIEAPYTNTSTFRADVSTYGNSTGGLTVDRKLHSNKMTYIYIYM